LKRAAEIEMMQAEDSDDDCLEFEGPSGGQQTASAPSFKDFLAKKKITFSDRFGKQAAAASVTGSAADLGKRRKTVTN